MFTRIVVQLISSHRIPKTSFRQMGLAPEEFTGLVGILTVHVLCGVWIGSPEKITPLYFTASPSCQKGITFTTGVPGGVVS